MFKDSSINPPFLLGINILYHNFNNIIHKLLPNSNKLFSKFVLNYTN